MSSRGGERLFLFLEREREREKEKSEYKDILELQPTSYVRLADWRPTFLAEIGETLSWYNASTSSSRIRPISHTDARL